MNEDTRNTDTMRKDTLNDTKAAPAAPRLSLGAPMTPGMEYVEDYLGGMERSASGEWLAQNIDAGFFVACPGCHFLHLPRPAWDLGRSASASPPASACDVCAHASEAVKFAHVPANLRKSLGTAPGYLEEARLLRAEGLYDLWMGGSRAADLWLWAEMAQAAQRVGETAQRGEKAQGQAA